MVLQHTIVTRVTSWLEMAQDVVYWEANGPAMNHHANVSCFSLFAYVRQYPLISNCQISHPALWIVCGFFILYKASDLNSA